MKTQMKMEEGKQGMYILGISALYHDAAAAIIKDGQILAAAQEERFTRKKHDPSFPEHAVKYCMREAGITVKDLECVVYYENPGMVMNRFMENLRWLGDDAVPLIKRSFTDYAAHKLWIHKKVENALGGFGKNKKLFTTEHHISHAASAFYPSPFEQAVILTVDGVGEWTTTAIGIGNGNQLELKEEIGYPDSIGLFYSAFTYFCGFKVNSGDYKFMGLAPYGKPVYYDRIKEHIIQIMPDGSYQLNMDYFDYWRGGTMINEAKFAELFGGPKREQESRITRREMDLAASVQKIVEELLVLIVRHAKEKYGQETDNLVLAGGVALNCVANGVLQRERIFKNIWVQPAAGDAGGALGAALYAYYMHFGCQRAVSYMDAQRGSYLGPQYSVEDIAQFLSGGGYPYHEYHNEQELYNTVAEELSKAKVIGLFQGRMEYGPRALGGRSIIADARSEEMQSKLNLKIKYRESFRPFAPSVLLERLHDYFELDAESPYMLLVDQVKMENQIAYDLEQGLQQGQDDLLLVVNAVRSDIPAVTHVDYSARIQTVTKERNGYYYEVLKAFEKKTGCGVIVNTSFNVRGEPIVCTPQEAYDCFMRTDMDILVLEHCILYKDEQPHFTDHENWREKYELD